MQSSACEPQRGVFSSTDLAADFKENTPPLSGKSFSDVVKTPYYPGINTIFSILFTLISIHFLKVNFLAHLISQMNLPMPTMLGVM